MKYRKLRIAWSVGWGVLCLLLIGLWVRSYWYKDWFIHPFSVSSSAHTFSEQGMLNTSVGGKGATWTVRVNRSSKLPPDPEPYSYRYMGFRAYREGRISGIWLPHWFPTIVAAALTTLPWLRWRFSLRTLLLGTTVVAVLLGLTLWALRES